MQRILLLYVLLSFVCDVEAQGIAFGDDFKAAIRNSKRTGKPVLLDAYTTWCAPCRKMDEEIFSLPAIGEAVALRYVPVRLDMESPAGAQLATRYGIRAYPTLMVLDSDGSELDRSVGYLDESAFMTFVERVREEPPSESFAAMDARFQLGTANRSTLENLVELGTKAQHPSTPAYVAALLDHQQLWHTEQGRALVLEHATLQSRLMDSLVLHRSAFAKTLGDYVVSDRIARLLDQGLFGEDGTVKPRTAKKLIRRIYTGPAADSTYIRYRMRRAREAGKAKQFGRWALRWQREFPSSDPGELEELVYIFDSRLPGWKEDEVARWRRQLEQ